jgi:hypothetical protein
VQKRNGEEYGKEQQEDSRAETQEGSKDLGPNGSVGFWGTQVTRATLRTNLGDARINVQSGAQFDFVGTAAEGTKQRLAGGYTGAVVTILHRFR